MDSENIQNIVYPSASLYLTGENLDPQNITAMLGIAPHRYYKRGDKRINGEKDRSHGLWMLSSSEVVTSMDPVIHINWVLEQLEPAKTGIIKISNDEKIDSVISCFFAMPSSHESLVMMPKLLQQIAALNIRFELAILSPDF